jgi:hypothetical protein
MIPALGTVFTKLHFFITYKWTQEARALDYMRQERNPVKNSLAYRAHL